MGGKSCLAVTLPLGELPSPGLVNPCLTARDHIFSRNLGSAFGVESGLSTQATGTAAFLQHLMRTLPRVVASVWHRHDGLGIGSSLMWMDRPYGRAAGALTRYDGTWHYFCHHWTCAGRLHARNAPAGDAGRLECARQAIDGQSALCAGLDTRGLSAPYRRIHAQGSARKHRHR